MACAVAMCTWKGRKLADYRQQSPAWSACVPRLPAYCQAVQLPATATAFVTQLQTRLHEVAQQVDRAYPMQTTLTIDAEGVPHLNASQARPVPAELATVEALLKVPMPAATRCAAECPLLGGLYAALWAALRPKLTDAVVRLYLYRLAMRGELGPSQTARHATDRLTGSFCGA